MLSMARTTPDFAASPAAAGSVSGWRVILVLWLVAELVMLGLVGGPVLETRLRDTDDYMRFVEVFDWLDGAGWRDLHQHRLDPPAGVEMHWARLPDIPLAAVVAAAEPWLGRTAAAMAAALVVPALTLLGVLLATAWAARPLLGRAQTPLAVIMAAMAPVGMIQLVPGRVDHHGWQNLLALIALGALLRLLALPRSRAAAAVAGLAFAAGLWIGAEAVPWLAAFTLVLAAVWIWRGEALEAGLVSAATLFGAVAVLFLGVRPTNAWLAPACDGFSITQLGLAGAVLVFWSGVGLTARQAHAWWQRLAAVAGWGTAALAGWLALFPDCLAGPYGPLDPRFAELLISHTNESQSVFTVSRDHPATLALWLAAPVLAIAIALVQVLRRHGRSRAAWAGMAAFLVVATGLGAAQVRVTPFAQLFAALPLGWLASRPLPWIDRHRPGLRRALAKAGLLLGLGPGLWIVPMLIAAPAESSGPADGSRDVAAACDLRRAAPVLADPAGLGTTPRLIASMISLGPELLFRTPHAVLAAPYHRDHDGIMTVHALFTATDAAAAGRLAAERGIDLILVCTSMAERRVYDRALASPGDGAPAGEPAAGGTTVLQRLDEDRPPDWAVPVALPDGGGLRLYRVVPAPAPAAPSRPDAGH